MMLETRPIPGSCATNPAPVPSVSSLENMMNGIQIHGTCLMKQPHTRHFQITTATAPESICTKPSRILYEPFTGHRKNVPTSGLKIFKQDLLTLDYLELQGPKRRPSPNWKATFEAEPCDLDKCEAALGPRGP